MNVKLYVSVINVIFRPSEEQYYNVIGRHEHISKNTVKVFLQIIYLLRYNINYLDN